MGPQVATEKCNGCGTCVEVCPADVFEIEDDKAKAVRAEECLDCGVCEEECPNQAISFSE